MTPRGQGTGQDATPRFVLSRGTLMPLGLVVGIVAVCATIIVQTNGIMTRISSLETVVRQSWMLPDQKVWELELRNANPQLNVPKSEVVFKSNRVSGDSTTP